MVGLKKGSTFLLFMVFSLKIYSQSPNSLTAPKDTLSRVPLEPKAANHKAVSLIAPAVCIGYGFISLDCKLLRRFDHNINADIREDNSHFKTRIDNYLQYMPMAAVYGLDMAGVKSKNNFVDRTAILLISNVIMASSVDFLKKETHRLRPNGASYTSFPSGHTATAFMNAEFMAQEYKDVSLWYSVAGYTAATATGVLRMYNNAHWFSDVIAGAGFGIISAKVAYWVYPYLKRKIGADKPLKSLAMPTYQSGAVGLSFIKIF